MKQRSSNTLSKHGDGPTAPEFMLFRSHWRAALVLQMIREYYVCMYIHMYPYLHGNSVTLVLNVESGSSFAVQTHVE